MALCLLAGRIVQLTGGKTRREIVRCLNRYAAREIFYRIRPAQPCPPL
ncbi:hypothetical protein GZL_08985 [Streptomyces sp. 769]|nr:hypothetical protein GZL_08985 [Streptomyces sp. 769]